MKKGLVLAAVALTATVGLVGCQQSNNGSNKNQLSYNEVVEYSTMSGINLLSSGTGSTLRGKQKLTDVDKEAAMKHLKMIDSLVAGDLVKSEERASTLEGYEKMYVITTTLLNGEKASYEFYFNEKVHEEKDEDDDEQEIEKKINGLVKFEDKEYKLVGKSEFETEKDESEQEVEFTIYADEKNYVEIKQSSETEMEHGREESEFELEYTRYVDGKKVSSTVVELEKEGHKVCYLISTKEGSNKAKYRYNFVKENNEEFIDVRVIEDKQETRQGRIQIIVNEDNTINYRFVDELTPVAPVTPVNPGNPDDPVNPVEPGNPEATA